MNHTRYILAIDPGSEKSAYVFYDTQGRRPMKFAKTANQEVLLMLRDIFRVALEVEVAPSLTMVIEFPQPRGQLASWQLFDTIEWAGRFKETLDRMGLKLHRMDRKDVKMHFCGISTAKDPQIRQSLIDHFGGEKTLRSPKCKECDGKGRTGWTEPEVDCAECGATGEVPGVKGVKKCPKCKGAKKVKKKEPVKCTDCGGSGQVTPGIFYGISNDVWQALAVAVTFDEHHVYKPTDESGTNQTAG